MDSNHTFDTFLAEVERNVSDACRLCLFFDGQLRLEIMLLRHERSPSVIWGLKRHEDWAFKATLLRFARGRNPVHLILSAEAEDGFAVQGWMVRRTMTDFWAIPLSETQAQALGTRRLPWQGAAEGWTPSHSRVEPPR